jgi:hypothetical protein
MITISYKVLDYVLTVRYFYFSTSFLKVAEVAISQMLTLKSSFLHTNREKYEIVLIIFLLQVFATTISI